MAISTEQTDRTDRVNLPTQVPGPLALAIPPQDCGRAGEQAEEQEVKEHLELLFLIGNGLPSTPERGCMAGAMSMRRIKHAVVQVP